MRAFAFLCVLAGAWAHNVNIVKLAESTTDLSILVSALVAADLVDTLSSKGLLTVFAPTDEAFKALPPGTFDKLMKPENKKQLIDLLTYHVLPDLFDSDGLVYPLVRLHQKTYNLQSVEGKDVTITNQRINDKDLITVNGDARVIAADNYASNGVVHIIDKVLTVPSGPAPGTKNIVQLAESVSDLSTLVAAVVAGDLADTLSSPGAFTVFAPTNDAFKALPPGTFDRLMKPENKKELVDILTYHVLAEEVLSKDLKPFQAVNSVEGKLLHVTKFGGRVRVGASLESKDLRNVIKADNIASNGVVHIIDGVLLPPSSSSIVVGGSSPFNILDTLAASSIDLVILVKALVAADLADTLRSPGPFTVFAPTDAAFKALPPGTYDKLMKPENKKQLVDLLTYHVLPDSYPVSRFHHKTYNLQSVEGKDVTVKKQRINDKDLITVNGDARVIAADNFATNGVVHIIDKVLTVPSGPAPPSPGPPTPAPGTKNIVQLAESVSDLSTLVAAVVAGDLADTLSSPGPFTVFAPTNDAFKALPPGTFDRLMKPENKKELVDILTYHVLPEEVLSKDLKPFQAVKTVEGKPLHVTKFGGRVRVGASLESKDLRKVIKADNIASNGVVHIIDGVLLPPASSSVILV